MNISAVLITLFCWALLVSSYPVDDDQDAAIDIDDDELKWDRGIQHRINQITKLEQLRNARQDYQRYEEPSIEGGKRNETYGLDRLMALAPDCLLVRLQEPIPDGGSVDGVDHQQSQQAADSVNLSSHIAIPKEASRKVFKGTIVAIGPGSRTPYGDYVPMGVEIGDRVLFEKQKGNELVGIEVEGHLYYFIREVELLARIATNSHSLFQLVLEDAPRKTDELNW